MRTVNDSDLPKSCKLLSCDVTMLINKEMPKYMRSSVSMYENAWKLEMRDFVTAEDVNDFYLVAKREKLDFIVMVSHWFF